VTIIQRQLGHTTLAQTMKYVAATDLDVATFIDRLDA
jgi:integrase